MENEINTRSNRGFINQSTDRLLAKVTAVRTNNKPRLSKVTRMSITHEVQRRLITEQRETIQCAIENLQAILDEAEAATNNDAPTWVDVSRLAMHVEAVKRADII